MTMCMLVASVCNTVHVVSKRQARSGHREGDVMGIATDCRECDRGREIELAHGLTAVGGRTELERWVRSHGMSCVETAKGALEVIEVLVDAAGNHGHAVVVARGKVNGWLGY